MKISLYLLPLLLMACGNLRTEVDPSVLSAGGEKLVLNGYISPQDTVLSVSVSRSKPALAEPSEAVPFSVSTATVSLSDGSRTLVFRYDTALHFYRAPVALMPIRAGQTYTLTASTADGKKVSAQATVPGPVPISTITLDSTVTTAGSTKTKAYRISFVWTDPPAETNFYRYDGYLQWNSNKVTYPLGGQDEIPIPNIYVLMFNRDRISGSLVSDDQQQGNVMTSQSAGVATILVQKTDPKAAEYVTYSYPGARVVAQLSNVEESYYRYTSAVARQRQAGSSPFAEPVLIPTNVTGGLGCFAAFNRTEKVLVLR